MLVETRDLAVRMAVTEWMFDKQLVHDADALQKNLLIKTDLPRLFDKQQHMPAPIAATEDAGPNDTMFN